mmetsp:Transcript_46751/g.100056  ORF Transcript_46751/g.100056 Transcript_46751/m.100056 type:complete len:418 (-) Transcript_46751:160-1413(-)
MEDLGHHILKSSVGQDDAIRILQLTDLHHFPAGTTKFDVSAAKGKIIDVGTSKSRYSTDGDLHLIETILDNVRPHLVVLTGDVIDGRVFGKAGNPTAWKECFLEVLQPIVKRDVPWTFVPGNHDDDGGPWSRQDLLGVYSLPGCLSSSASSFDHTLTVSLAKTDDTDGKGEALRLWFFDSGGNHEDPKLKYHTFNREAVEGFLKFPADPALEKLGATGSDLAFFHIPLPQAKGIKPVHGTNGLFSAALNAGKVPSPWHKEPFTTIVKCLGKDMVVGCSELESGLFRAFSQSGRVLACLFGHDHASDAVYLKDNLYMIYGRVGGSTPPVDWEGDAGELPFKAGARVIQWSPSRLSAKVKTWIETADGQEPNSHFALDRADVSLTAVRPMLPLLLALIAFLLISILPTLSGKSTGGGEL